MRCPSWPAVSPAAGSRPTIARAAPERTLSDATTTARPSLRDRHDQRGAAHRSPRPCWGRIGELARGVPCRILKAWRAGQEWTELCSTRSCRAWPESVRRRSSGGRLADVRRSRFDRNGSREERGARVRPPGAARSVRDRRAGVDGAQRTSGEGSRRHVLDEAPLPPCRTGRARSASASLGQTRRGCADVGCEPRLLRRARQAGAPDRPSWGTDGRRPARRAGALDRA